MKKIRIINNINGNLQWSRQSDGLIIPLISPVRGGRFKAGQRPAY
jgi:hypothetical protein